ncbi:LD-carboxypeptidase [Lactobacillus panisapium]|nr:LD-carboxypeptidase [Lactobacillus panisapium]
MGTLGEDFAAHQLKLGKRRIEELGLKPVFMPHALKGIDYVRNHPEKRAADLKEAFLTPNIKGIVAAIGGDDTYRILPYLLEDEKFKQAVANHPKLFTGYSDTTNDHLLFYRLGMQSFYGISFLNDFAELDNDMLSYTAKTIAHFFTNPPVTDNPASTTWYEERTDFSPTQLGQARVSHPDTGYKVLRGKGKIQGQLWGGCLDSLADDLGDDRYPDEPEVISHYHLLLSPEEAKGKLLFIETCEEQPEPALFREKLAKLDKVGILPSVSGILVGKPQNKKYFAEYQQELLAATADYQIPILYNVNFGHAYPHTVLPYGATAEIDCEQAGLRILEPCFA